MPGPQIAQAAQEAAQAPGWIAALGVLGLWAWRAIQGAHKLGRIEQKLDDHAAAFAAHDEQEKAWRADITKRIDELYKRER